jgi:hypothetical protein
MKNIKEAKTIFSVGNGKINFNANFRNGNLSLLPSSSKDFDMIELVVKKLSGGVIEFLELLEKEIKKRTKLEFETDYGYKGAGYSFKLSSSSIEDLL